MKHSYKKHILVSLLALLLLSGCGAINKLVNSNVTEATTENLYFSHEFQWGEEGVEWMGMIQNQTDKYLRPFIIELYLTFKDGKEYLAAQVYMDDGMKPKEIYKLYEDITDVYRENKFGTDDHKSFHIVIKQQ